MEGVASIALLPSGAISGHFIRLPDSICYGLQGTRNPLSHSDIPLTSVVDFFQISLFENKISLYQSPFSYRSTR
jgi:hypothetical protein